MEDVTTYPMSEKSGRDIKSIVKEYGKRLFGFIRGRVRSHEDAEDILQDVWFQLSNLMDLDSIGHLSGWLYQVARNRIIDQYRKKKTASLEEFDIDFNETEFDFKDILFIDPATPETESLKEIFWEELFNALDELPENQRQVFIWNELEDLTLQEIADKTGENLKTIISRKGYAVKYLRKKLESLYNDLINYK
jgi:RNA polymerase sigma factor (sigma-70 family)